jgi:hypothetical protein
MNDTLNRNTVGFGLSAAIVCIVNAVLVVVKETSHAVQVAMTVLTGHHWVTHGLFDVILFLVLGFLFSRAKGGQGISLTGKTLTTIIVVSAIVGWAIITVFIFLD